MRETIKTSWEYRKQKSKTFDVNARVGNEWRLPFILTVGAARDIAEKTRINPNEHRIVKISNGPFVGTCASFTLGYERSPKNSAAVNHISDRDS